ncbi:hypothetical protein DFH09DRAFT_1097882 [Mycena vulgaris]|nr:hypothetical protein DFH09DRAFT_1097882 [Mycena vulgaris]
MCRRADARGHMARGLGKGIEGVAGREWFFARREQDAHAGTQCRSGSQGHGKPVLGLWGASRWGSRMCPGCYWCVLPWGLDPYSTLTRHIARSLVLLARISGLHTYHTWRAPAVLKNITNPSTALEHPSSAPAQSSSCSRYCAETPRSRWPRPHLRLRLHALKNDPDLCDAYGIVTAHRSPARSSSYQCYCMGQATVEIAPAHISDFASVPRSSSRSSSPRYARHSDALRKRDLPAAPPHPSSHSAGARGPMYGPGGAAHREPQSKTTSPLARISSRCSRRSTTCARIHCAGGNTRAVRVPYALCMPSRTNAAVTDLT